MPDADPVTREAYSHEVISFGFWAGDQNVREPTYYSYTRPSRPGCATGRSRRRRRSGSSRAPARWPCSRTRPCATAADPRAALLDFLESAYEAGADAAGWDRVGADVQPGARFPPA